MGGTVTVVTHAELSTETITVALGLPVDTTTGTEVVISVGKQNTNIISISALVRVLIGLDHRSRRLSKNVSESETRPMPFKEV